MAHIDVKITDLAPVTELENGDLFLVSHPIQNSDGTLEETPYTSNCISAAALSGSIKGALEKDSLNVSGKWEFHTTKANLPTQDFRFAIRNFLDALKDNDRLTSIVNDDSGWYHDLPTSVVQKQGSGTDQSINISNNSIANVDFVQRAIAGAYQQLFDFIKKIFDSTTGSAGGFTPSHIGQIIMSTRLDTENKVRAIYGDGHTDSATGIKLPDTHWIRHSGYFLRGASSGVSAGNGHNMKDDGNNTVTLAVKNLPKHSHGATFTGTATSFSGSAKVVTDVKWATHPADERYDFNAVKNLNISKGSVTIKGTITPAGKVTVKDTGSGSAFNINPPYKNVYIWERIS